MTDEQGSDVRPRCPNVTADIEAEKVFPQANWYDVVNTTRRALVRANLIEESVEFEAESSVAVGKAMTENPDPRSSINQTFRESVAIAQRWVVVLLPESWTRELDNGSR